MVLIMPSLVPLFAPNVSHPICQPFPCIGKHVEIAHSFIFPQFSPFYPISPCFPPFSLHFSSFPIFPRVFGDLGTFRFGYPGASPLPVHIAQRSKFSWAAVAKLFWTAATTGIMRLPISAMPGTTMLQFDAEGKIQRQQEDLMLIGAIRGGKVFTHRSCLLKAVS